MIELDEDHGFHKKLTQYVLVFTVFVTAGSIIIGMGITLVNFSMGLSLDALDKQGETYQFFKQLSNYDNTRGYVLMSVGLAVILGALTFYWKKINKLK